MSAYTYLTKREDNKYLSSRRWMCDLGPTGSHHWIVKSTAQENVTQVCKYCHEKRRIYDVAKFNPRMEDKIINDGKTSSEL